MGTCLHLNMNAVLISFSAFFFQILSSKTITSDLTHCHGINRKHCARHYLCPSQRPAPLHCSQNQHFIQWLLGLKRKKCPL